MLPFLKNIKIEDPGTAKKTSGGGGKKQWNPLKGLVIRLWKSGAMFPSQELVDRFSLEYGNKTGDAADSASGNGFDIFKSSDFPIFKTEQPLILLNVAPKSGGKIDAFGSVAYNEDGTPKVSVMDQGAVTFGKDTLIDALKSVYDVEPNEAGFIDLVLLGQDEEAAQQPFTLPNDRKITHIPKEISRGAKAGEQTVQRRENPELYVLYPYALLHPEEQADDAVMNSLAKRHSGAVEEIK